MDFLRKKKKKGKKKKTEMNTNAIICTLLVAVIAMSSGVASLQCSQCDYVVPSTVHWTNVDNADLKLGAGSTVCLSGQNSYKGAVVFLGFEGTKDNLIRFTNCDGQAVIDPGTHCLFVSGESDYFHVDGSGSDDQYGIRLKDCSFGVRVTGGAGRHYSEISRVYVDGGDDIHASFRISTDPTSEFNAGNFEMRNGHYHDNKCRNSGSEVCYF
jgi:hypothetical protein